jgi:hypothetical protein
MTAAITAKSRDAWFILEAADLRGLPAPFVVRVTEHRVTELGLKSSAAFDTWATALNADPTTYDTGGMVQRTATGVLHDMPVSVFVCESGRVTA